MVQLASKLIEEHREKAREYRQKRDECARHAQEAHKENQKDAAKQFSIERKKFEQMMNESNETAAAAVFIRNNQYRYLGEIDLHDLYVGEAIKQLESRVKFVKRHNMRALTVIVGQGHHSKGGARIKPAVARYAKKNNILCDEDPKNPGRLRFEFEEVAMDTSGGEDVKTPELHKPIARFQWPKQQQETSIDIDTSHFRNATKLDKASSCTITVGSIVLVVGIFALVKLFFGF